LSKDTRNYREELRSILNSLADSLEHASDEAVMSELHESGEDPELRAKSVRTAFETAFKRFKQKKLKEAQLKYKSSVLKIRELEQIVPQTIADLRVSLAAFFNTQPHWKTQLLTAQCREFKDLTDTDIRSLVKQLKILGAWKDVSGNCTENV